MSVWCALLASASSLLNDGGLTMGGTPTLLGEHPSVVMKSEVINIKVKSQTVTADCRFDFYNEGPACDVRMGFPDKGDGADDPYEALSEEEWPTAKVESVFSSFRSWVDGKPVTCEPVKGKNIGDVFQTKMIHFPAHSHVKVRDLYSVATGGGVAPDGDGRCRLTGYIVHTGASWKGNIGSSTIIFNFSPSTLPSGASVLYQAPHATKNVKFGQLKRPSRGVVCYGPVKPVLKGRTLTYSLQNWRPTPDDDIFVQWGYKKFARNGD